MAKPKIEFSLTFADAARFQDALSDPVLVEGPLQDLFKTSSDLAQMTAKTGVKGGTGMAIRTIKAAIQPMGMQVYSAMPKRTTKNIEMGRSVGSRASLWQLANWIEGRVTRGRRLKNMSKEQKVTVRTIAEAIRARGTKGRFFMRAARQAVEAALPGYLSEMAHKMEQHFLQRMR